ncbi:MAG: alpha/beta hydrolase [Microbacteriaceae bacterium]|nr:alpha/beta hydrolase [Microbacteriaceae bacterium]
MIDVVHANAPLHPDALSILATLQENKVPEWHTLGAVRAREVYNARVAMFPTDRTPVGSVEDRIIPGPGGDLAVRIYQPLDRGSEPVPALLYIHGGGWTLGGLDSHDELCRRLCEVTGGVVLGVDYRLAPEHPYPAPLDDCRAALEWLAASADELGVDARRLSVGGDSAGGNLAAGLCVWLRDHGGPSVIAQLLLYPGIRPIWENLSYYENAYGKFISRADCVWFWKNYLGETLPEDPYSTPGVAELTGLPRALVVTAGHDPLRDDGEIYGHQLAAAGNDVEIRRYDGMMHGFLGIPAEIADARDALAAIATTLEVAGREAVGA